MVSEVHGERQRSFSGGRSLRLPARRGREARLLAASASGLTLVAMLLPLWQCTFTSPQYKDEPLRVVLSTKGLNGDLDELARLDQYIGVHVPTALPELGLLRAGLVGLALLLLLSAVPSRGGRWARRGAAAVFAAFLASALAVGQWRLYLIGHDRTRSPIAGFHDFTPLIIGPTHVGNFHVLAVPGAGGWALAAAGLCVALAVAVDRFERAK